jgi:hypothetical protein
MIKGYVQDKKCVLRFFLCFIFTENITRVHNKRTGGKAFRVSGGDRDSVDAMGK